jgi:hypothetical protein
MPCKVLEVSGPHGELEKAFNEWLSKLQADCGGKVTVEHTSLAASVPSSGDTYYTLFILYSIPADMADGLIGLDDVRDLPSEPLPTELTAILPPEQAQGGLVRGC